MNYSARIALMSDQPEDVKAVVNHRVNLDSNAAELEQQTIKTLLPVVKSYNLTLVGFDGKTVFHGAPFSKVILNSAYGYYTDPSPRSPTDASDPKSAYTILASTARGMWASRKAVSADGEIVELESGKDLVMAPFMSTGVSLRSITTWRLKLTRLPEHRHQEILGSHQEHLPIPIQLDGGCLWRPYHQRENRE